MKGRYGFTPLPWDGVRFVAFGGSPQPTHAVETTETFDAGVRPLAAHRTYLDNLAAAMGSPDDVLRPAAEAGGRQFEVHLAATFEVIG